MDNSKESLKNALIQALSEKYSEELEKCCEESAQYSYRHHRRMCTISGAKLQIPVYIIKVKRRVIAALITAAALLLIGCTAIVYKEKIGNFFTEVYQDYIRGVFAESEGLNKEFINEYYTLTYVPDGYELVETNISPVSIRYVWKSEDSTKIIFEQKELSSFDYYIDNENGETTVIVHNDYTIYRRIVDDTAYYIWSDEKYAMSLYFENIFDDEEVKEIIDGICIIKK